MSKTSPKIDAKPPVSETANIIDKIAAEPATPATPKVTVKTAVAKKTVKPTATPVKPAPTKAAAKPVTKPAKPAKTQATKATGKIAQPTGSKAEKESKIKKAEPKKAKLIRDSFTFPETDYALFALLKQQALQAGREVKKSELLRAGLAALAAMSKDNLIKALAGVESIKTGRPSKK